MARWGADSSFESGIGNRGRLQQLEDMQQDINRRMQDTLFRQKYATFDEPRRLVGDIDRHFDRMDRDSPSPKRFGQAMRTNFSNSFEDPGMGRFSREYSPVAQPQFYTMGRSPNRSNRQTDIRPSFQMSPSAMSTGRFATRSQTPPAQQHPRSTVPPEGYLPDRSCFVTDENGARRFKVEFDIGDGFEAENVRVIANGSKITVKVNKLEKDDFSTLTREFTRTVDVPDNVNPKEVKAFYLNGMLVLDAPVKPPQFERVMQSPDRFRQPIVTKKTITKTVSGSPHPVTDQGNPGSATAMSYGYNAPRPVAPPITPASLQDKVFYQSSAQQPSASTAVEDHGSFSQSLNRKPSGATQYKTSSAHISLAPPREKTPPAPQASSSDTVKTYFVQQQPAQRSQTKRASFTKESSPPGGRKFVMEFSIGKEVQPGDINIHTQDGVVHVTADWQEERAVGQPVKQKTFHKSVPLPVGVDPESVTAHFLDGGKLVLEAPVLPYGLTDV